MRKLLCNKHRDLSRQKRDPTEKKNSNDGCLRYANVSDLQKKENNRSFGIRWMAPCCCLRPRVLCRIHESPHRHFLLDAGSVSHFAVLTEPWNFWISSFSFVSLHLLKLALLDVSIPPQLASGPRLGLTRIDCLPVRDYGKGYVLLARSNRTNAHPLRIWYFQVAPYPTGSLQVCYEELRKLYPVVLARVVNLVSRLDMW